MIHYHKWVEFKNNEGTFRKCSECLAVMQFRKDYCSEEWYWANKKHGILKKLKYKKFRNLEMDNDVKKFYYECLKEVL